MFSPDNITLFMKVLGMLKDVLLGATGGIMAYLLDYSKARRKGDTKFVFSFSSMLINMLLGAFVAYSVGTFLPPEFTGRDALIGFSGLTAYQILLLVESRFANIIFEKLSGKTSK